jgi:hypothetical protein
MVEGSIPFASMVFFRGCRIAAIAGDCKSPDFGLRWFESTRPQKFKRNMATVAKESSKVGRVLVSFAAMF